jgi:CGNL1 protein
MIDKVNKKERTKKYYYDQSCNKLINFFKDDVHQQFVDFISKTDEFTKFKNIAEQILDDKIEVVKTLENSNYKNAENLKDLRDKINYRKKQLIEKFNNKQMNQNELDELLQMNLKELEIKRKSEVTLEEYQKEYLKTQEIIRDGNFSINDNAVEKLKSLDANLNNFLKNLDKNTRAAFKSTFNDLKTVLSEDIEKLKVKKQELENENALLNQNINTARLELNMINVNEKQKLEIELKQLKKNHLAKKQELLNNQKTEIENLKEQVRQKVSLSDKEIKEIEDEVKKELILKHYNEIKKNKDFIINDFSFQFNKNLYRKFEFETFDRIDNAVEIFENNNIEDSEITLLKGLESQEDEDNNKVFDILNYAEDYSYYNYEYKKNECLSDMEKILNKLKEKFKIFKKVITNTIKKIKKNTKDFINSR